MVFSLDKKEGSDIFNTHIWLKNSLRNIRTEGIFLNLIKDISEKPMCNIILNLNHKRLNVYPVGSVIPLLINIVLKVHNSAIKQGSEIKIINIGKEEVNMWLLTGCMILFTEKHVQPIKISSK